MSRSMWREIAAFYVLALMLSWSYWLWLLASGSGASHLPGLLGPMVAALIVTAFSRGAQGVREILKRMILLPSRPVAGLLVGVSPLLALAVVVTSRGLATGNWPTAPALLQYSGISPGASTGAIVILALVLNGYGEETGWRGFLFDRVAPALGRFRATLLVIALWLVWHIPAFFVAPGLALLIGPTLIGWAIGLALGAFVLSHVYLLGGRSIMIVALWHTCFNFATATPATQGTTAAIITSLVMVWGGIVAVAWTRR